MTEEKQSALNIRNFPSDVLAKLKSQAALAGKTLQEYVTELLRKQVSQ